MRRGRGGAGVDGGVTFIRNRDYERRSHDKQNGVVLVVVFLFLPTKSGEFRQLFAIYLDDGHVGCVNVPHYLCSRISCFLSDVIWDRFTKEFETIRNFNDLTRL